MSHDAVCGHMTLHVLSCGWFETEKTAEEKVLDDRPLAQYLKQNLDN